MRAHSKRPGDSKPIDSPKDPLGGCGVTPLIASSCFRLALHECPSRQKHVVIAGGSGFLGVSLALHLADHDFPVTLLSRNPPKIAGQWEFVAWDGRNVGDWKSALNGAAALVNLAGRSVDCIKSPDHCDEILRSRVETTEVLGKAMRTIGSAPPVWVQMSTAHIYARYVIPSRLQEEGFEFRYASLRDALDALASPSNTAKTNLRL